MKKRVGATSVSAWVAHALAWAAGILLVLAPVYQGVGVTPVAQSESMAPMPRVESVTPVPEGEEVTRYSATLIEVNGLHVIWLLLVPVLLTGVALWATRRPGDWRARRKAILWGSSMLLLGLCALSILSIGVIYLPAAFALVFAAVIDSGRTVA